MHRTTDTHAAPRAQTATSRQAALAILGHNHGFAEPERWVEYALGHSFSWVRAIPVPACPDCGAPPRGRLGQYVHYSTLMQLLECPACGLIWASARLDPAVIRGHFEQAYKGEEYFAARADIFGQLVREISRRAPYGARVLDVGGAQGHLMHQLCQARPDLAVVVQDLSEEAVRHAREVFGLETLCGPLHQLARHHRQYDVVVLSDVLYYEPRLPDCWRLLPSLVAPGGSVVIRVPNKLPLIRLVQGWRRCGAPDPLQDRIRHFNPDHIYLLTRRYLTRRLAQVGFGAVRVLPSPPLRHRGRWRQVAGRMLFLAAGAVARLTGGRVILTPSQVLVAAREGGTRPDGEGRAVRRSR